MSAPESTAVIHPAAPPAPAHATAEQVSALHRRLDEFERWIGDKFHELLHLAERIAPVIEKAGAAVAPALGAAAAPVIAAAEEVAEVVGLCAHPAAHAAGCTCGAPTS